MAVPYGSRTTARVPDTMTLFGRRQVGLHSSKRVVAEIGGRGACFDGRNWLTAALAAQLDGAVGSIGSSVSLSSHFGHRPAWAPVGFGPTVGEGSAVRRLKQQDAPPFQNRGQGKPGGETAQMGDDSDATLGLHRRRQSKQLLADPKAEHHEGGNIDRANEDEQPIKDAHVGAGPDQEIGSDHATDRTGGADQGYPAGWIQCRMGERANKAAYQVEEQVAVAPHGVLDVVAVKPEEPHVAR